MIGHSMGGLVSRSACHYSDGHWWPSKVRHVFTLGTPHTGAPLEKAATVASAALARLPETRGLARALQGRSAGIQDLGHGYLVDEDWADQDPDAFFKQAGSEIPFLTCANHYFVCATVSRQPDAAAGRVIGDLLVLRPSAWAHRRSEASGCASRSSTTTTSAGPPISIFSTTRRSTSRSVDGSRGRPALAGGAAT